MKKLLFIFLFLFTAKVFADEPSIRADITPPEIGLGESAQISIQVDRRADRVVAPDVSGLSIDYMGVSQSHSISISGGRRVSSATFTYTFRVSADGTGGFLIPEFKVIVGGEEFYSSPMRLDVVEERQQAAQPEPRDASSYFRRWFRQEREAPAMFLRFVPSEEVVYQNQPVIMEVIVFSSDRDILQSQFVETSQVYAPKIIAYDISSSLDDEGVFVARTEQGRYYARVLRRYVFYPVESGEMGAIAPAFVAVTSYGQIQLTARNAGFISRRLKQSSGLSYIGNLKIESSVSTNTAPVGKVIDVRLVMEGDGNLKIFSNPFSAMRLDGVFVSTPQSRVEFLGMKNGRAVFRQTLDYTFLVQREGVYRVPPIAIDYFDHNLQPREAFVDGFEIIGLAGVTSVDEKIAQFGLKDLDRVRGFKFALHSPILIILIVLGAVAPVVSFFVKRHRDMLETDGEYSRKFLAKKRLSKYLSEAETYLSRGEYPEFYRALQKGVFYYITDKAGISRGLGIKAILQELRAMSIDEKIIGRIEYIYEECNYSAYSGVKNATNADNLLSEAKTIFDLY